MDEESAVVWADLVNVRRSQLEQLGGLPWSTAGPMLPLLPMLNRAQYPAAELVEASEHCALLMLHRALAALLVSLYHIL